MFYFSSHRYLQVELLDHINLVFFFQSMEVYIPTNRAWVFPFLYILNNICCFMSFLFLFLFHVFLILAILVSIYGVTNTKTWDWVTEQQFCQLWYNALVVLVGVSLVIMMLWSFTIPNDHMNIFIGNMSIHILCPFLNLFFFFFALKLYEYFILI